MSDGPDKPKPDYKSMWSSYSQWLLDARSRFEQSSAISRAKQAAAGFRVSGATVGEKKALQEFTESERSLRSGYTYETLSKGRNLGGWGITRRMEEAAKLLTGPEDIPIRQERVGARGGVPSREDFEQDRVRTVDIPLYKDFNITKEQYTQQFNRFVNLFGRNPDSNEMYYTLKYGLPSQASTAPSDEERAKSRAEKAAGQAAGRTEAGQKAALRIGAEEDESKSPWI